MLSSTQKLVLHNSYQGESKRVLCVCSVGILRSPSLAIYLHKECGYNTRSCGTNEHALIPLSENLILWADEIYVLDDEVLHEFQQFVKYRFINLKAPVTCLHIEDDFEYMQDTLLEEFYFALRRTLCLSYTQQS